MFKITCITTDENNHSVFSEIQYVQYDRVGMLLSDQIGAKNFRLRESAVGYTTQWHLSGDPTLISILKGTLRITLQNNNHIDFKAGEVFIAADNLPQGVVFDSKIHGHKAEVIGEESLYAFHIKLDNFCMV